MKQKILMLLSVTFMASGIVLKSGENFEVILSNFGEELTFYGLGVNFTQINNFTFSQMIVNSFMDCKTIFRVVISCQTAFAEQLDNGTIICTYFQQPIYQLPTVAKEKGKAFAFNQVLTAPFNWNSNWTTLKDNGRFYVFAASGTTSTAFNICYGDYPNGRVIRPKTADEYMYVKKLGVDYGDIIIDLRRSNAATPYKIWGGQPTVSPNSQQNDATTTPKWVWGDGSPYTGSFLQFYYSNSDGPYVGYYYGNKQLFDQNFGGSHVYKVICEIDPFTFH